MSNEYTFTIKGPEGTEIWEGDGFLLIVQHHSESGTKTSITGHDFNGAEIADTFSRDSKLAPIAFGAVGLAIGKRFAPPDPADIKKLMEALDHRYGDDEDDGDEDDE
jgi:hypothetical protein